MFLEKGWSIVAAFQTRNPMHRSHEHLVKIAVEVSDGVFIHQVLGKLKAGDIPADVRTRTIQAMIDNYFRPGTVIQAGYPIEMRYAGPREALLHALIRQNFGCSHLIVGRDHAGVGSYYGPFDAHHIFDQLWDGALHHQAAEDRRHVLTAGSATGWRRRRPVPTIRRTTFRFPARSNVKCSRPTRTYRLSSAGRRWWRSSRTITQACDQALSPAP